MVTTTLSCNIHAFSPSVALTPPSVNGNRFNVHVSWHESDLACEEWRPNGPLGAVFGTPIFTRQRYPSGTNWYPQKNINHGSHNGSQAVIAYNHSLGRLGVLFQCATHSGYVSATPAENGSRGWSSVSNLADNVSAPSGGISEWWGWYAAWSTGTQPLNQIVLNTEEHPLRPITKGTPLAKLFAKSVLLGSDSPMDPSVQPDPFSRTGSVDLGTLVIPGWGEEKLRRSVRFDVTDHDVLTQQTTTRVHFAVLDTLNLFADWLGSEALTVPQNAQTLRVSASISIHGFRVLEPPPANVNPVVFQLIIKDVQKGKTLGTLGLMRLRDVINFGRRDTTIDLALTSQLGSMRGKTVAVDVKIVGQENDLRPWFSETYLTPEADASPIANRLANNSGADPPERPTKIFLHHNYPNPFNPQTAIQYDLPEDANVDLSVFNTLGQEVARLAEGLQPEGYRSATFDASSFPSGVYFYRLNATGMQTGSTYTEVMKMLLIK
jgi:hypothetical protein